MLGTGEGCHDTTHRCGQRVPWRWIDRILSIGGGQAIMWKSWPWTIMGNVFGQCHAPCTLKSSCVVFGKEYDIVSATKKNNKILIPTNLSILFSGSQRLLTRLTHPFPHFYMPFIYMYCCTYSHPAYNWNIADWTFSKHQSISQSHLDEIF
jgi:hypothetical protein